MPGAGMSHGGVLPRPRGREKETSPMTMRMNAYAVAPQGINKMVELEDYLRGSGLEYSLFELVKIRASQINGCAYCIHMHTKDARAAGETEERLHLLAAWRESSYYTPRERAA